MHTIETLAREYREALSARKEDDPLLLEQIVTLEENQIDYLDAILSRNQLSTSSTRTAQYLKNLLYRILNRLNELLKNPSYVPSFRSPRTPCRTLKAALEQSQIDIFVLYDKLSLSYDELAYLLSLENRKTALFGFL